MENNNEDLNELVQLIEAWGVRTGLYDNSNPQVQCLKLGSEFGELCDNLAKGRYERAQDDVGDMIVVLIHIAKMIGVDLGKCVSVAYNDIKDRKGHFSEYGVFIKEGDV